MTPREINTEQTEQIGWSINRIMELLVPPILYRMLSRESIDSSNNPEGERYNLDSIYPIEMYSGNSPRLQGFQLDTAVQADLTTISPFCTPTLPIPSVFVISDQVYARWQTNGQTLTASDIQQLTTCAEHILQESGGLTLRRAIHHKDTHETPLASTFNNKKTPAELVASLHELFTEYQRSYPGKEFIKEACVYSYIDPPETDNPMTCDHHSLPVGGYAVPTTDLAHTNGRITIKIASGFGDSAASNAGHPESDEIIVHVQRPSKEHRSGNAYIARRTTHPVKTKMIVQRKPPSSWNSKPLTADSSLHRSTFHEVPIGNRVVVPTLTDEAATAIALHLANCMWKTKTSRKIEFSMGRTHGKDGIDTGIHPTILENVPFIPPVKESGRRIVGTGPLTAILNSKEDLDLLPETLKKTSTGHFIEDRPIVALSTQFLEFARLDANIRAKLAGIGQKVVLVATLTETEHTARALSETHELASVTTTLLDSIVDVESAFYQVGKRYTIVSADGVCMLHTAEEAKGEKIPHILTIPQAIKMGHVHPEKIGGKSYGLATLDSLGFPIPEDTLTLSRTFFAELIKVNGLSATFSKLNQAETVAHLEALFATIHANLKHVPPKLTGAIISAIKAKSSPNDLLAVAVRSNLSMEDSGRHPMAGTFNSELNIPLTHSSVAKAILRVIRGYFAPGIANQIFQELSGNDRRNSLNSILGSVIIQKMLPAEFSGTIFTYNVNGQTTTEKECITLQYSPNTAGVVDGGKGKPVFTVRRHRNGEIDQITYKSPEGVVSTPISVTEFIHLPDDDIRLGLSKKTIVDLLRLGKTAAKAIGSQQDMEWAVTEGGKITFLQTRPILTI